MAKRASLTKAQRQTAAGAELMYLCQAYTQDGRLADEEISALRQWLVDQRESDLPALAFLTTTVEQVLADGIVTPAERTALYKAIETVLPPDRYPLSDRLGSGDPKLGSPFQSYEPQPQLPRRRSS